MTSGPQTSVRGHRACPGNEFGSLLDSDVSSGSNEEYESIAIFAEAPGALWDLNSESSQWKGILVDVLERE
jgi:hypothetical protein